MIDTENFILSLKVNWVKRLLHSECNSLLKSIYEGDLKPFEEALLFECIFKEVDINNHLKNKPFLKTFL